MKYITIVFLLALSVSCKKVEQAKIYSLNKDLYNHLWFYGNSIRQVNSGITRGSSYNLTFSGNNAMLSIDGGDAFAIALNPISDNKVTTTTNGVTSTWTYTVDDTARTLNICFEDSTCSLFVR